MNEREFIILNQYLDNITRCLRLLENSNELINNTLNNSLLSNTIHNNYTNNVRRPSTNYRYNNRNRNLDGMRRYNSENSRFDRFYDTNNENNNNGDNNNNPQSYVLRFDTLIPNLRNIINTMNDVSSNVDYSYNIYNFTSNDENMNEKLSNYDILDIENFSLIENPMNDICPITRERFHNEQNVLMICSCKHIFNKSGLNIWIRNNNTCPSCRVNIHQNN